MVFLKRKINIVSIKWKNDELELRLCNVLNQKSGRFFLVFCLVCRNCTPFSKWVLFVSFLSVFFGVFARCFAAPHHQLFNQITIWLSFVILYSLSLAYKYNNLVLIIRALSLLLINSSLLSIMEWNFPANGWGGLNNWSKIIKETNEKNYL